MKEILSGNKIKQGTYSDRYLQPLGLKILTDLLKNACDRHSQISIKTLQDSISERKQKLEDALQDLATMDVSPKLTVQPKHEKRHFPHPRILEITKQDKTKYKIIFDCGLDFIRLDNDLYTIARSTYIAVDLVK